MSIDAKAIRADRFAEIGNVIQRNVGILIDRWSRRAIQEEPQAKRVHQVVLHDQLPSFLSELGRGLIESGDPFNCPHYQVAVHHGEQRWEAGWSLSEVFRDYQILRLVVLDYLDEVLDRPLLMREVLAVGLALDESIEASVVRYTQFCEQQAKQQTEALRLADHRKNEFLAMLAHELRNPLAPLRNSLEVVRLNCSDPAMVDQVRGIMDRQVTQLTRLVDDLLDMSRIALGKLELRKERLNLCHVLAEVVQTSSSLAEDRRQIVTADLPSTPLWLEGDHSRLVQIFINLLNNAIKFTPDGGRVRLQTIAQDGQAVVRVQDNGVGIPEGMLSQIFDLFTQIELGSERAQGGLGIGLSLVRQLVELHGGTIRAKSDGLNQGSEFIVSIPLVLEGEPSPARQAGDVSRTTLSRRILLVEDNPDARNSLALLLKLVGHEVVVAENGQHGIEAATRQAPDVALIDIGLPDMNGYQVASQLKALLTPHTVLVALTGFSQPEDRQRALDAGFHTHLTKPVDLRTIQALLATFNPPTHS